MIIKDYMDTVGLRSIEASHELQSLSTDDKNKLLLSIADSISKYIAVGNVIIIRIIYVFTQFIYTGLKPRLCGSACVLYSTLYIYIYICKGLRSSECS